MMLLDCKQPSRWCETSEGMMVELQPSPGRSDCVSTLVSMKLRDIFAETSGQFPVMFARILNQDMIFSEP